MKSAFQNQAKIKQKRPLQPFSTRGQPLATDMSQMSVPNTLDSRIQYGLVIPALQVQGHSQFAVSKRASDNQVLCRGDSFRGKPNMASEQIQMFNMTLPNAWSKRASQKGISMPNQVNPTGTMTSLVCQEMILQQSENIDLSHGAHTMSITPVKEEQQMQLPLPQFGNTMQFTKNQSECEEGDKHQKTGFSPFDKYPATPSKLTSYQRESNNEYEKASAGKIEHQESIKNVEVVVVTSTPNPTPPHTPLPKETPVIKNQVSIHSEQANLPVIKPSESASNVNQHLLEQFRKEQLKGGEFNSKSKAPLQIAQHVTLAPSPHLPKSKFADKNADVARELVRDIILTPVKQLSPRGGRSPVPEMSPNQVSPRMPMKNSLKPAKIVVSATHKVTSNGSNGGVSVHKNSPTGQLQLIVQDTEEECSPGSRMIETADSKVIHAKITGQKVTLNYAYLEFDDNAIPSQLPSYRLTNVHPTTAPENSQHNGSMQRKTVDIPKTSVTANLSPFNQTDLTMNMLDSRESNRKKIAIRVCRQKRDSRASPDIDSPASGAVHSLRGKNLMGEPQHTGSHFKPSTIDVNTALAQAQMAISGPGSKESTNSWKVKGTLNDSQLNPDNKRHNGTVKEVFKKQSNSSTKAPHVSASNGNRDSPMGKRYTTSPMTRNKRLAGIHDPQCTCQEAAYHRVSPNPQNINSIRSSCASSDHVLPSRFKGFSGRDSSPPLSKQRFSAQNEDLSIIDDQQIIVRHLQACKLGQTKPKTPNVVNERLNLGDELAIFNQKQSNQSTLNENASPRVETKRGGIDGSPNSQTNKVTTVPAPQPNFPSTSQPGSRHKMSRVRDDRTPNRASTLKNYKVDEPDNPVQYYKMRVGPIKSSAKVGEESILSQNSELRKELQQSEPQARSELKELLAPNEVDLDKMPHYQGKITVDTKVYARLSRAEKKRVDRDISKLTMSPAKQRNKLKIDERLWQIGTQDKTSMGIDPSLGKPADQQLYKKRVKGKSIFYTDVFVNKEATKERTIELDQFFKQNSLINNKARVNNIIAQVTKQQGVSVDNTPKREKSLNVDNGKRLNQTQTNWHTGVRAHSKDVALKFVRSDPADPYDEKRTLLAKTMQIESTFDDPRQDSPNFLMQSMRNNPRESTSLIARHHSQFNSQLAFPQQSSGQIYQYAHQVNMDSQLQMNAHDSDELICAVPENKAAVTARNTMLPSTPLNNPIMMHDMQFNKFPKEVPFSADQSKLPLMGVAEFGSRTPTVYEDVTKDSIGSVTIQGQPVNESKVQVKPLDLKQLTEASDLDMYCEAQKKEATDALRSTLTWHGFKKASPSIEESIVRLDQSKQITKDQVKEFFNTNGKLKQIREKLMDPRSSSTSQAQWSMKVKQTFSSISTTRKMDRLRTESMQTSQNRGKALSSCRQMNNRTTGLSTLTKLDSLSYDHRRPASITSGDNNLYSLTPPPEINLFKYSGNVVALDKGFDPSSKIISQTAQTLQISPYKVGKGKGIGGPSTLPGVKKEYVHKTLFDYNSAVPKEPLQKIQPFQPKNDSASPAKAKEYNTNYMWLCKQLSSINSPQSLKLKPMKTEGKSTPNTFLKQVKKPALINFSTQLQPPQKIPPYNPHTVVLQSSVAATNDTPTTTKEGYLNVLGIQSQDSQSCQSPHFLQSGGFNI